MTEAIPFFSKQKCPLRRNVLSACWSIQSNWKKPRPVSWSINTWTGELKKKKKNAISSFQSDKCPSTHTARSSDCIINLLLLLLKQFSMINSSSSSHRGWLHDWKKKENSDSSLIVHLHAEHCYLHRLSGDRDITAGSFHDHSHLECIGYLDVRRSISTSRQRSIGDRWTSTHTHRNGHCIELDIKHSGKKSKITTSTDLTSFQ